MYKDEHVIDKAIGLVVAFGIDFAIIEALKLTQAHNTPTTVNFYKEVFEYLEGIKQLYEMSREELDLVPFTVVKWQCQAKGCCNGTKVRDYGIKPIYWRQKLLPSEFFNVDAWFWMCAKHLKFWKRLIKKYPEEHVYKKLMDVNKKRIVSLTQ